MHYIDIRHSQNSLIFRLISSIVPSNHRSQQQHEIDIGEEVFHPEFGTPPDRFVNQINSSTRSIREPHQFVNQINSWTTSIREPDQLVNQINSSIRVVLVTSSSAGFNTSKHQTLNHWWFNVGPPSTKLGQHYANTGSKYCVCCDLSQGKPKIPTFGRHYNSLSWCKVQFRLENKDRPRTTSKWALSMLRANTMRWLDIGSTI